MEEKKKKTDPSRVVCSKLVGNAPLPPPFGWSTQGPPVLPPPVIKGRISGRRIPATNEPNLSGETWQDAVPIIPPNESFSYWASYNCGGYWARATQFVSHICWSLGNRVDRAKGGQGRGGGNKRGVRWIPPLSV